LATAFLGDAAPFGGETVFGDERPDAAVARLATALVDFAPAADFAGFAAGRLAAVLFFCLVCLAMQPLFRSVCRTGHSSRRT
jgi:hypothetical protein